MMLMRDRENPRNLQTEDNKQTGMIHNVHKVHKEAYILLNTDQNTSFSTISSHVYISFYAYIAYIYIASMLFKLYFSLNLIIFHCSVGPDQGYK